MKHTEIEQRLIKLAKENPTGDYYVGGVGSEIRQLLRDMMGKRYPSDELDEKPYVRGPRPDESKDPYGAIMWDEEVRMEQMLAKMIGRASKTWSSLIAQEEFPTGIGATCESRA